MIKVEGDYIWCSNEKGSINICTGEKDKPPYICFYPAKPTGLPPLAIYVNEKGEPTLQFSKDGKEVTFINLFDLVTP